LVYYDHRNLPIIAYLKKTLLGRSVSDVLYFYYDGKGQRIKKTHQLKYVCDCKDAPVPNALTATAKVKTQARTLKENSSMSAGGPPIERCICTKTTYTYYIYSGDNIIAEYGQGDTLQNNYLYGGNGRVAIRRKGTQDNKLLFPITDHLGSTRMVVDSTGTVQAKYTYYPFGDNLSSWVSQGTDYKFTGKELDEESNFNLYYFGARYYDAKIARWISVDPINLGSSPYTYCYNNPLSYIDREGEYAWFLWPLIGAALGTSYAWAADVPGSDVWKYTLGGAFLTSGIGAGASLLPASKVAGFAVMGATLGTTGAWANNVPGGEVWKYAFAGLSIGGTLGYGLGAVKGGLTLGESMSLYSGIAGSGAAIKGIEERSSFGDFWGDYIAGRAIGALYGATGYGYMKLPAGIKWFIRADLMMHTAYQGTLFKKHHGYAGIVLSLLGSYWDFAAVNGGILESDDYLQHVIIQTYVHPNALSMGEEADNIYPSPLHSVTMWIDSHYASDLPGWLQDLLGYK